MKTAKICHLSSVHSRNDIRVFHKECLGLSDLFEVYLIVADGKGNEVISGINIIDVGMPKGRIERIFLTTRKIFRKALDLNPDIYHFHDPELIPMGVKLRKKNKTVIYDIHEDVPRQILAKNYIFKPVRKIVSIVFEVIENRFCRKFDALICATPHIQDRFIKINTNTFSICNFPLLREFPQITKKWEERSDSICYIGGISKERGIFEMIGSLKYSNCKLSLAGEFESPAIFELVKKDLNWNKVSYFGKVSRVKIAEILSSVKIGMVTLQYTPNHLESLPIKMFEYMAAGIPVIASNFPLWKEIVEANNLGLCVDPLNPQEIGNAIARLLNNSEEAILMGKNGRKAVIEKFNWEKENEKLLLVYNSLL